MSHIHVPDGVLPTWLWLTGWALAACALVLASRATRGIDRRREVPLVGAVSALMLVAMSTEVVPIAYHINLTVVAGVLLGPALSVIAAFVVVLALALLGHGGITVGGLNTLMIAAEMVVGWALARAIIAVFGRARIWAATGLATLLTLALTTTLLVGLVALAGPSLAHRETGALDPETLTFANPFGEGVVALHPFFGPEDEDTDEDDIPVERFARIVYTLGPFGWALEALISASILGYVARVRPTLIAAGSTAPERHALPGHGQGG